MRPMHNMMIGLQHCSKYKMALNDLYVERVQGINGVQNPSPREIVRKDKIYHTGSKIKWPFSFFCMNLTLRRRT